LAEALLEFETLSSDEIRSLLKNGKIERPNLTIDSLSAADIITRHGNKKSLSNQKPTMMPHANIVD
jgi:hypothetical protein